MSATNIHFHDLHSVTSDFGEAIVQSLGHKPVTIAPKYFYDSKGSQLFDAITQLDEYYQTRTETAILSANVAELASLVGTGSVLIEPGGGSCEKIHILLDGLKPKAYVPMDISKAHLRLATTELAATFPWLEIHAICIDYSSDTGSNLESNMVLPAIKGHRMAFFPGSSIGNFTPKEAVDFLAGMAQWIGSGGYLLIGVDLKKDISRLEAAYNDAAGITAQFNLNLLTRINRELGANFNLEAWQHKALYNQEEGRIEMHLISQCEQTVTIDNIDKTDFHFACGEGIHTENSYKYSNEEFIRLAGQAGFAPEALWMDDKQLFAVHLFRFI